MIERSKKMLSKFTLRERQILPLLMEGLVDKEIAPRMGCSVRTVKFHLRSVYAKLGVSNRKTMMAKFGHFEVRVVWIPNKAYLNRMISEGDNAVKQKRMQ